MRDLNELHALVSRLPYNTGKKEWEWCAPKEGNVGGISYTQLAKSIDGELCLIQDQQGAHKITVASNFKSSGFYKMEFGEAEKLREFLSQKGYLLSQPNPTEKKKELHLQAGGSQKLPEFCKKHGLEESNFKLQAKGHNTNTRWTVLKLSNIKQDKRAEVTANLVKDEIAVVYEFDAVDYRRWYAQKRSPGYQITYFESGVLYGSGAGAQGVIEDWIKRDKSVDKSPSISI